MKQESMYRPLCTTLLCRIASNKYKISKLKNCNCWFVSPMKLVLFLCCVKNFPTKISWAPVSDSMTADLASTNFSDCVSNSLIEQSPVTALLERVDNWQHKVPKSQQKLMYTFLLWKIVCIISFKVYTNTCVHVTCLKLSLQDLYNYLHQGQRSP